MKLKYYALSKEKRKEVKEEYFSSDKGKKVNKSLTFALLSSIACFIYSIYLIYDAFFKTINIENKIYSFTILASAVILFIAYYKVKITKLNEYVIKKKYK